MATVMINGLGAWWFPRRLRGWLTVKASYFFKSAAWEKHDIGYNRGFPDRATCDRKFLQAMMQDAADHPRPAPAALVAVFLWLCVRAGGHWSYNFNK